ncbi:MAG: histidine--tRNA ligase [Patescibacteria group bacterium]|nr:histidine--tRNA ligase [Patescibacteria group bacterium]MDD5164070.1 histidine--tRNA ligase [Patescibacteria group bacterium]MDD5534846.1 histidine--tRNA ligase [Patescibacteria group bacterium]
MNKKKNKKINKIAKKNKNNKNKSKKKQLIKRPEKSPVRRENKIRNIQDNTVQPLIQHKKYLPKSLRGMEDILPEEGKYWDFVFQKAQDLAEDYGFKKIETPVLEERVLFEKSTGMTTEVVEKQMYQFTDRGQNQVALRPEFTPSMVRAYIEHGMFNLSQPIKLFCFGPLFRYERPQAGRLRQFHQINLEVLGSDKPVSDAQVILFCKTFFEELGIKISIQINSLGCLECRKVYRAKLINYFKSKRNRLCPDCQKRLVRNPLRILDCKQENCKDLITDAPQIVDSLCENCHSHFVKVLECLDEAEIAYELNPFLVRGLDYYTRTVFEIVPVRTEVISMKKVSKPKEENKELLPGMLPGQVSEEPIEVVPVAPPMSALGGGGRYDNLVGELSGRETPALGVAFGVERIIEELKYQNIRISKERAPKIFLAQLGELAMRRSLKLLEDLRKEGFRVAENLAKDSLRAQLEMANKIGVKLTLILGQQEMSDKTIIFRDMSSGNQETIDQEKMIKELRKRI